MFRHLPLMLPAALAGAIATHALSVPAQAGGRPMAPAEALSVLAQARTLDARCGFLNGPAHEELAGYAARAEIVTAERMGAKAAESAVDRGSRAGRAAACDGEGRALVRDALAAAREAMRQARGSASTRRSASRRPAGRSGVIRGTTASTAPERKVVLRPARNAVRERSVALARGKRSANFHAVVTISGDHAAPRPVAIISGRGDGGTRRTARIRNSEERYVAMTAEYYRRLRCGTTDRKALLRMYEKVRRAHYELLRSAGPKVTARAKARARTLGARGRCGMRIVRR